MSPGTRLGAGVCLVAQCMAVLWVEPVTAALWAGSSSPALAIVEAGATPVLSGSVRRSRPSFSHLRLGTGSQWFRGGNGDAQARRVNASFLLARASAERTYADSLRLGQSQRQSGGSPAGFLLSGLGIFAGVGLAAYFKSQANGYYNEYLVTADPEYAREAFENAERYDRATVVGWIFAQLSFLSLIYFISKRSRGKLVPVEGEPLVRPQEGGVVVGFRYTP